MTGRPIKLTLLAHSMRVGGAEVQFSALARGLDRARFSVTLVSFHEDGALLDEIRDAGIPVVTVGKRGRGDAAGFLFRIARAIRATRPDMIYSFLDFPNLVAALAWPFGAPCPIVWGIRTTDMRLSERGRLWQSIYALQRMVARRADLIICNSWAGRQHLIDQRFPSEHMVVVPNGIDTDRFRPRPEIRAEQRRLLGLDEHDIAIGLVARLDPVKDHRTFLRAAGLLYRHCPNARFVCVGGGAPDFTAELHAFADSLQLGDRVIWTGTRSDIPELLTAFDIATLNSAHAEGFPNVVGEAMAAGLPCVVTDVGDAAMIVDGHGLMAPIGDAEALAQAWRQLVDGGAHERRRRGDAARKRIVDEFPLQAMIDRTADQLLPLVQHKAPLTAGLYGQAGD